MTTSRQAQAPANGRMKPDKHDRLLVISNCQTTGLANCLEISGNTRVDRYAHLDFAARRDEIVAQLPKYRLVLMAPFLISELDAGVRRGNVIPVPLFNFDGYHPDHCNMNATGGPLNGHFSILSFAAYQLGMPLARVVDCFNVDIYQAMGYMDHWGISRKNFLQSYASTGFDLSQDLVNWSRHGPATYIPAHPKIQCLMDLAKKVLQKAGFTTTGSELLPPDNLAKGVVFPVYPEIGSRIGVKGAYQFKPANTFTSLPLDHFLAESYRFFKSRPDVAPDKPYLKRYELALRVLQGVH